jgi:putative phage-type endonuclease
MIEHRAITSRDEWLDWRQSYLTASDIGAVAGVDAYRNALRIFAEKTGMVPGTAENGLMRRGRLFEASALEYLREEQPTWKIWQPNVFITDDESRLACTPDAFAEDSDDPGRLINVQIKTIGRPVFEDWDGRPPLGYRLQVNCENYLSDAARGILAVLVVSTFDASLVTFDVPRRPDVEATLRDISRQFWADLDADRRPALDYARDGEVIRAMLEPKPTDPPIDLSHDNRIFMLLERHEALTADIKASKDDLEAVKNEIIAKLDGAEKAIAGAYRLTWRDEHKKAYSVKESTSRRLRISHPKEAA